MVNPLTWLQEFFRDRLWQDEGPAWRQHLFKALRLVVLAAEGLVRHRAVIQASTLAYSTMLALIPLLALLFAILKGLGIQRLLSAQILERLAPGSQEFAAQIFQYIEETRVTSLGVFGVVVLLAALVVVMTNVERAFNEIWQVSRSRPWRRKLSDYLSIFLIFPILMAGAISIATAFLGHPEIRRLMADLMPGGFFTATTSLVSVGILWVAFTFIYLVMPNTRVHFRSAIIGGVVGGSLWQVAQWIFIAFQGAATYYNAIYGALYHLLFLVIWMFWSWLIVLFGSEVAHAHQHLEQFSREFRERPQGPEPVDEYLALAVLLAIGGRFYRQEAPLSLPDLSRILQDRNTLALRAVAVLEDCGLVVPVVAGPGEAGRRFFPAQPLEQLTLKEVLAALRRVRGGNAAAALAGEPHLAAMIRDLVETAAPTRWDSLTLRELLQLTEPKGEPTAHA